MMYRKDTLTCENRYKQTEQFSVFRNASFIFIMIALQIIPAFFEDALKIPFSVITNNSQHHCLLGRDFILTFSFFLLSSMQNPCAMKCVIYSYAENPLSS